MMNIGRTCKVAFRALGRNKMRSFLTTLGIIIGVGAVIAMVSIGEGARQGIEDRFAAMGTDLLFVSPGSQNVRGVHSGWGSRTTLKVDDAQAILDSCDAVMYISPAIRSLITVPKMMLAVESSHALWITSAAS